MHRLGLPFALLLAACGEDTTGTSLTTTTGDSSTSTGSQPTTSGAESSTSSASTSQGSDSATDSATGSTSSPATTGSTGSTTMGLDESSSGVSTTADDTTSTGTTSDDTTSTTNATDTTTTDDTTTGSEVDPPPIPNGMCNVVQGPLTTFIEPMPTVPELHIVAMYQATGNAVTVTVNRVGVPLTLVLSSYEPVAFTLDLAPGVQLDHVILNGYNKHTVQGQGAAMVTDISEDFVNMSFVACGYFWPMNDGGCDTPENVASAELLTGLTLTTFAGCYEGISFTLD